MSGNQQAAEGARNTRETIAVVVRSARSVAKQVRAIELIREDGLALPAFSAGAHIDLHLGPQLVRQYSLCSPCDELGSYMIAVKLEPESRGGSQAVHTLLNEGSRVRISAPRNLFRLDEDADSAVLVAGGIGITPLFCMALRLQGLGRAFRMHYFARAEEYAAFSDVLGSPRFAAQCSFHYGLDHADAEAALDAALSTPAPGKQLYLCGPKAFMDMVRRVAARHGWTKESIHLEHFSGGEPEVESIQQELTVRLARSDVEVPVAADISISDALRAAGIDVETSCEQGICGTCITRVLDGVPEHRDLFLTDAEKARGDCMAICVSRAFTRYLVLDL